MFLAKDFSKKTGRTYLRIVHGYRDKYGKPKRKTIQSLGYLDELEKKYADPIAHFTKIAKEMDFERLNDKKITITFDRGNCTVATMNRKVNSILFHIQKVPKMNLGLIKH